MGGLLDRATHVADQTFEPKPNPDATTIVLGEVSPPDPDGTTGTGPFVDGMFGLTGGATQGIAFGLSALFALIGMIITFRMGSIRVGSVVFLFAALGVGLAPDLSFGRFHPRIVAVVVVALLLNAIPIPLMAGFDGTGSGVISEVSFDEDENELVFKIYASSSGALEPSIEADGVEVWSDTVTVQRDQKTVRVDVAEFFAGNGVTYDGVDDVEYRILLGEDTYDIDGDLLTRMPTHAGVEIEQKVETTSGSANSNSRDEVVGLYISTIVGLKDPQAGGSEDGGDYANRSISTFPSDYSFTLTIVKGGQDRWTHPVVTVDGTAARWSGGTGDIGFGFISLGGDRSDDFGVAYLSRDAFFNGDGCYEFHVEITRTHVHGSESEVIMDRTSAWEIDWEERESRQNDDNPPPARSNLIACN